MSDFIFTTAQEPEGRLARAIQSIYHEDAPAIQEFHGQWGSLAVSRNLHQGFAPIETDRHICLIIGGPVLSFTDNEFLAGDDPTAGTTQVLARWCSAAGIRWDEDLSGPFVVLRLDKQDGKLEVITDLMSFTPVFEADCNGAKTIGTHVDAAARVAGCKDEKDATSIADFILHGVVTYPYTVYANLRQVAPSSTHNWHLHENARYESKHYWQPLEGNPHRNIDKVATSFREALIEYVHAVTSGMDRVGLFLSGGEDSRVILSMLPKRCKRDAFIFLEGMNREGSIAQKVANTYGANLNTSLFPKNRYLDVLPHCSDLVGSGSQYTHVHSYGFHKSCGFSQYPAVFGGLYSDGLTKGAYIMKLKGSGPLPFIPKIKRPGCFHLKPITSKLFHGDIMAEINQRHTAHYNQVCDIRPKSADEWFDIWPISGQWGLPNLHGNRRLFRSYEPFTSSKVVKISAAAPQSWKLNRRLFLRMAKPLLKPARYLPHGDGWMPYYPWYANCFIRLGTWSWRKIQVKTGMVKGNQGSFADLEALSRSDAWKDAVASYSNSVHLPEGLCEIEPMQLLGGEQLNTTQKLNLLQVLYSLKSGSAS